MEVILKLDDNLIQKMMEKTGASEATDLTKEAMSLLHWAINESSIGRTIISTDNKGNNVKRLSMPILTKAANN